MTEPGDVADRPVHLPAAPGNVAAARTRFLNSGDAFNTVAPLVLARIFTDGIARARAARSSGFILSDQAAPLERRRNVLPSLTFGLNWVPAGAAHSHHHQAQTRDFRFPDAALAG